MRSSKYFKRIMQIIIFLIPIIFVERVASNILVEPNSSHYFNYDVQELIQDNKNVDMILLGGSRVQLTFDPYVIEKGLNIDNVLNAGTAAQPITASYYLLKSLLNFFDPQYVVLGLANADMVESPNLQASLVVMDRMPFFDRLIFFLNEFPRDFMYISNAYRYRSNIDDDFFANCKLRYIEHRSIKNGIFDIDTTAESYYVGKGFNYFNVSTEQGSMGAEEIQFDSKLIRQENIQYLDKIVQLCKEQGIQLYLVTGITSMERLFSTKGYQNSFEYYSKYADEHDIKYYNLNYLVGREEFLPDTFMYDRNHVNGEGAKIISRIFADIINKDMGGGVDTTCYFYTSFDDLKQDVNRIISIGYNMEVVDKTVYLDLRSLTNDNIIPEYRVLLLDCDGSYIPITKFSKKASYIFNLEEYDDFAYHDYGYYIFRVEARKYGCDAIDAYQEYIRTDWKKNWLTSEEKESLE